MGQWWDGIWVGTTSAEIGVGVIRSRIDAGQICLRASVETRPSSLAGGNGVSIYITGMRIEFWPFDSLVCARVDVSGN